MWVFRECVVSVPEYQHQPHTFVRRPGFSWSHRVKKTIRDNTHSPPSSTSGDQERGFANVQSGDEEALKETVANFIHLQRIPPPRLLLVIRLQESMHTMLRPGYTGYAFVKFNWLHTRCDSFIQGICSEWQGMKLHMNVNHQSVDCTEQNHSG